MGRALRLAANRHCPAGQDVYCHSYTPVMTLDRERQLDIVGELASRPGHEKVRTLLYSLLVDGLGARSQDIFFEVPLNRGEIRGRADALLGRTVIELKSDLRAEMNDAREGLARYLTEREVATGDRYVGIATDGASFVTLELRGDLLVELDRRETHPDHPGALLRWLDSVLVVAPELLPTPAAIRRELGRETVAYRRARGMLADIWSSASTDASLIVKRQLWSDLLARVYGSSVDADDLWFQHTYLTIVAKTMAVEVVGVMPTNAADLLAGRPFSDVGIYGAVESDFFDWVLEVAGGPDLVMRIARLVTRFRLRDVDHDVLKVLYESLIDPETRHDLGEFYTPDWLASRMCDAAITNPLEQRVLDPACGSGTFLFHAVRKFLAAAHDAGLPPAAAVSLCCSKVLGIDVHPVAAIIARVTYLLAIGESLLRERPSIAIPVYLGDSAQWNTRSFMAEREIQIDVPGAERPLFFPFSVTRDPVRFDSVIGTMLDLSEDQADESALRAWLARDGITDPSDAEELAATYRLLRKLRADGADHIWGYVARNLSRPIWLSSEGQRPNVIIGNPPWLSYRYMSPAMQIRFRDESKRLGIWVGSAGRVSHQDLSGYFFSRCIELYLSPGGTIAFVMPFAALSRHHFERFRGGTFSSPRGKPRREQVFATVRFDQAWGFDDSVQPLFPVPSCVLIGTAGERGGLPPVVMHSGRLPRRDATPSEADAALISRVESWQRPDAEPPSMYADRFRAGAIVFPRVFFLVTRADVGRLGGDPSAPLVRSRRTRLEKLPWRNIESLEGRVESEFLRPLYLGESIAPYRLLEAPLAVIPWDAEGSRLLDRDAARGAGRRHLAAWITDVETLWAAHAKRPDPLVPRLDYFGQLSAQMPPAAIRVVYGASGTLPAAAILRDRTAIIEHKLYWAPLTTEEEARYLEAVLNSETTRGLVEHLQSRGQWGARDFDKVMLSLPIPRYDSGNPLHANLAAAAARAEAIAATVPVSEVGFVKARQTIRAVPVADGVAAEIDVATSDILAESIANVPAHAGWMSTS